MLEQEGWRAAVAERARRELGEREAALKAQITRERDEQITVCVCVSVCACVRVCVHAGVSMCGRGRGCVCEREQL